MKMASENPKKTYKHGQYCVVTECHNRQGREQCGFFRCKRKFVVQTDAWRQAINRINTDGSLWTPGKRAVICAKHFVSGKPNTSHNSPDYVPSIFATLHLKPKTSASENRFKRTDHIMSATVGTSTDRIRMPCTLTNRMLSNQKKCKSLCGVSLGFFNQTMESLQGQFMKSRVLTDKDQLVLYFMKLKTRLSFIAISTIMNVHHTTASKSFCHTLNAHFEVARKYLWYLTGDEVKATLPDSFKLHYPNTRVIIDASETKIQCPCAVNSSVLCYSHYKSNHTCKWLVGIAPCGLITFMSRAFGGRVTGKDIQN
jgi:hypothetical protein